MKKSMKYICMFLMMVGISTSVWGTNSFDVSSITIDDLDWGTSTDYLTAYVGYDNGSIVTSDDDDVWFQAYFDASLVGKTIYVAEEGHTDGFGFWDLQSDGYVGYISSAGEWGITFQYLITEPYTSHTATIKFFYYDGSDPSADASGRVIVLSIPVTINMTGGYVISTAVDPSATGSMTAKVNGSARTRVMSNERLDLVATPADGYQFLGWTTDGDEDTDWEIDNDMSASTYAYIHANQTITANFEVACTSRSITMSNFSKDFGSADFVPTHSVSAGSGTKTWTSSNTDVATIVDGKVHIVAAGTTTIGLSVAADDPYCAVSKNCTMTVNALVPTVTAFTGTSTTPTSITLTNAQVSNKGGAAITAYGYIYSTTASTTEALKLGESGVSTATVASADIAASTNFASKTVSELATGTTYYVRAYATNSAGTGYSAIQSVKTIAYTDYKFSCADWTLTGPSGDIVFITSAASKTVRSQEAFHVSGSGLPHSTALTFTTFPVSSKFEFKKADGTIPATDTYGVVDADVYVFYTPDAGDTSDGLDELTSLTVSVTGEPRTATIDTKRVIGRHLPSQFVIAAKKNGKWWALPSNMESTSTPAPVEIAVDDADNPTIAYTATTNMFALYDQSEGEYIKLAMKGQSDAPLFGSASTAPIGKSGSAIITSTLVDGYLWKLVQSAEDLSYANEAKYTIYSKNNSTNHLRLKATNQWGLYDSGIEELRLIPASSATVVEAYFVEYGSAGGVIEVDAGTISATKVLARLNGNTSNKIALSQTLTSVKNRTSAYNYTVTFDGGVDFTAATAVGKILMLEWYNSSDVLVGVTSIEMPKIISTGTTTTMSSINNTKNYWKDLEVHVLPGTTLSANTGSFFSNAVAIRELHIYPGATVQVKPASIAGTLTVETLILRNGWSRAGTKKYDVARLYIQPYIDASNVAGSLKATNVYADWYIDYDQYYPVAVPWNATVANFEYRYCTVSPTTGPAGNIRLRYYDGASRATNVQEGVGSGVNWKEYGAAGNTAVPTTLTPSTGYVMTAKRPSGKAFSIIRMPLTLPSGEWSDGAWTTNGESGNVSETHKDQIAVTAHNTGSTPSYAQGWNIIANPYMALHQRAITYTGSATTVQYVNIPDVDFKEYDQQPTATAKLKPASAFLIQAPETGTITFGTANRKASAPTFRVEETQESIPEQQAYIVLNNEQSEDMMGILVSDKYSVDYEINADLEKLLGDGTSLKTYMHYGNRNMAYVAINEMLAKEWIPVTVRIQENGEYTYSLHEASIAGELEGIYLIDYANGNKVTNLIEKNYSFAAEAGTISGRFAINAIVGQRDTPTDIDIINAGGDIHSRKPIKFIWNDKVFILHNGVIYDSTGKRVREINK